MANSQKPPPGFGGAADPGLPLGKETEEQPAARTASTVYLDRLAMMESEWAMLRDARETDYAAIDQLRGQLQALEQKAAMHEGEIKKIIAACVGYEQAFTTARSHLEALARREMQQGMWAMALGLAIQAKGPADDEKSLVRKAEAFHVLLLRDLPAAIPINTQSIGNSHDDDPADLPAPKGPTVN